MAAKKYIDSTGLSKVITLVKTDIKKVDNKIGDITTLTTTEKTNLVKAINELVLSIEAGGSGSVVTMETTPVTEGALKSYTFKQGEKTIGTVDIPKDLVVTEGSVVVVTDETPVEGLENGTYIKLVIANQEEALYINVGTLVDLYIAEENATQVQVTVDNTTRKISAAIVAGSIGTNDLADGSVTIAKLSEDSLKRITDLEDKVGDGFEALTDAEIEEIYNSAGNEISDN